MFSQEGRGRDEMRVEARMLCQPVSDVGMLVCAIVGADEVPPLAAGGRRSIWRRKLTAGDRRAAEGVVCGKRRGGAMALIDMRHGCGAALVQRQSRLGAIDGLDLAFLVAAQHQGMFRRIQLQAHDIFQILNKLRIAGDLEGLHLCGLSLCTRRHPAHSRPISRP